MIRKEVPDGWLLVTHVEHARLAGLFAEAWGNDRFAAPEPGDDIRLAVRAHDDGWAARDASPFLTDAGVPEAFTQNLIGAYSALEDIDLPNYLQVRENATAALAARSPFASIVVSMHTVNLLTEQADLATIPSKHRALHADFVAAQRAFQQSTAATINSQPATLERGFRHLQCCDSLSLIACCDLDQPRALRHRHPDLTGSSHILECVRQNEGIFRISPFPFREERMTFPLEVRRLAGRTFSSLDSFRRALAETPFETRTITLIAS